jgi:serine/threonine-protein kinase
MIGQSIAHYRVTAKLGAGGMGEVFRATDSKLGREVALKILPPAMARDLDAQARLVEEARHASSLNHPHICQIYEVNEAAGTTYIALELAEGLPLSQQIPAQGMPADTVIRIGQQIADALAHAHSRGVLHRDLKCANVMLTREGNAKVLDFGLAQRVKSEELAEATRSKVSVAESGTIAGTLPYLAPEVLSGQPASESSDIWALGVMLYEMAAGTLPFGGRTGFELTSAILRESPRRLENIPPALQAVIQRCLAKEPSQRYQKAAEIRAALETMHISTVATGIPQRERSARARWLLWSAAGIALALAVWGMNLGGLRTGLHRTPAPHIRSLVVLPFDNLARDTEQEYFVDGMTDAVIAELSKIKALRVISRTSAMQYKGTQQPTAEIARKLKVDGVIAGSLLRTGHRVRITVQLIDPHTDTNLWSESYDRDVTDILDLQREVARQISREIKVALAPGEEKLLAAAGRANPEAHELHLKGRYYWNKLFLTEEGLQRARSFLEQAIEKDPGFAPSYTELASCLWESALQGYLSPLEAFPQAEALALKALALNPNLANAITVRGAVKFYYEWNWAGAEEEYKKAIAANPNYENAHRLYGYLLLWMGRTDEARASFSRAMELDPLSLMVNMANAQVLGYSNQLDEAIQRFQATLDLDPNFAYARLAMAQFQAKQGKLAEALESAATAVRLSRATPNFRRVQAQILVAAGKRAEAESILNELLRLRKENRVRPHDLAALYGSLGKMDKAFEWLDVAIRERDSGLVFLKVSIGFDSLRGDPRFKGFLRRLNFPE